MFKVQSRTPCGCTCACVVACLHPHKSISNVVVSLMIHDYIYFALYTRDAAKNMEPLWKVKGFFNRTSWKVSDVQNVRETWVLSFFSVCVSLSVSACCVLCVVVVLVVVVLVVVEEREGGREGRRRGETNRIIWAKVSLKIAETEQC